MDNFLKSYNRVLSFTIINEKTALLVALLTFFLFCIFGKMKKFIIICLANISML